MCPMRSIRKDTLLKSISRDRDRDRDLGGLFSARIIFRKDYFPQVGALAEALGTLQPETRLIRHSLKHRHPRSRSRSRSQTIYFSNILRRKMDNTGRKINPPRIECIERIERIDPVRQRVPHAHAQGSAPLVEGEFASH
jgi:hypothetical protein